VKKIALWALAVGLLWNASLVAWAKDEQTPPAAEETKMKPVAVLAIASYDRIMSDIAFIGKLSNNPELDKNLEGMLKLFTQGQGVNGLDRTRPWGAAVTTDGMQFQPLVFLPVVQLQQLLTSLAPIPAIGEAKDMGDGIFELQNENVKLYVKEQNGWAFIGQLPESLANLPKDPAKLLGGLDRKYEIALRLNVQNIPDMWRSIAIDQIKAGMQSGLERKEDENDAQYELRQKIVKNQVESFTRLVNETDQLAIGWALDQKKNVTHLDVRFTAIPDSRMAKQFSAMKQAKSRFTPFLVPDAAIATHTASSFYDEESLNQMLDTLQAVRTQALEQLAEEADLNDEATRKAAQEIMGDFLDAVNATVKSGKIDGALAVLLVNNKPSVVAGSYIADPMALERALRKTFKLAKEKDPNFPDVQFDARKHGDVRFHTISIPIKDEKAAAVLGNQVPLFVGIGTDTAYLAAGEGSYERLTALIDESKAKGEQRSLPGQLSISLLPILEFANKIVQDEQQAKGNGAEAGDDEAGDDEAGNDETGDDETGDGEAETDGGEEQNGDGKQKIRAILAAMIEGLKESPTKDHVKLVIHPIKNGFVYRLLAEEGIMKALGKINKVSGGAMQFGGNPRAEE